jgi:hypothetical protein
MPTASGRRKSLLKSKPRSRRRRPVERWLPSPWMTRDRPRRRGTKGRAVITIITTDIPVNEPSRTSTIARGKASSIRTLPVELQWNYHVVIQPMTSWLENRFRPWVVRIR